MEAAMRMVVITDTGGNVVGTAREVSDADPAVGNGGPTAGPSQSLHLLDVPDEVANIGDVRELHNRLGEIVPPARET
jgi:hypothetical protein